MKLTWNFSNDKADMYIINIISQNSFNYIVNL